LELSCHFIIGLVHTEVDIRELDNDKLSIFVELKRVRDGEREVEDEEKD